MELVWYQQILPQLRTEVQSLMRLIERKKANPYYWQDRQDVLVFTEEVSTLTSYFKCISEQKYTNLYQVVVYDVTSVHDYIEFGDADNSFGWNIYESCDMTFYVAAKSRGQARGFVCSHSDDIEFADKMSITKLGMIPLALGVIDYPMLSLLVDYGLIE